jgi:3-oxoadipate enol-lactonase
MSGPTEEDLAVNGTTLHVRRDGKSGPWVVLLNSLATDLTMWEPQIPALAQRFRVLRFDARGHGESAAPPAPYTMDLLVDDVLALLAHHGIARAHLVGLSLGGVLACAAALKAPASVASIVCCDSRVEMPAEFLPAMEERNRLVRAQGIEAVVEPFVARWFTPAGLTAAPQAVERVRAMIRRTSVEGFVGCAEALKAARVLGRLGEIRVPSLFLVGDQDVAVPTQVMQDQRARVPGSRYVEIAAAGHVSNIEQPTAFNEALLDFLR